MYVYRFFKSFTLIFLLFMCERFLTNLWWRFLCNYSILKFSPVYVWFFFTYCLFFVFRCFATCECCHPCFYQFNIFIYLQFSLKNNQFLWFYIFLFIVKHPIFFMILNNITFNQGFKLLTKCLRGFFCIIYPKINYLYKVLINR